MNKKKRIAILFAVIIVAVGIIIAVTSHQKKEMDFDEFADCFEKSVEEVLGARPAHKGVDFPALGRRQPLNPVHTSSAA